MTKADDSPQVTIPRQMLQDVLAEHLTKSVFDNIEQRDELIRSLEGFCDGLRFSASILDLAADDRLTLENFGEMIAKMTAKRS